MPAGASVPAHTHPHDELVTVIEGTWYLGKGERYDPAKLRGYPPGSFIVIPAGVARLRRGEGRRGDRPAQRHRQVRHRLPEEVGGANGVAACAVWMVRMASVTSPTLPGRLEFGAFGGSLRSCGLSDTPSTSRSTGAAITRS